MQVDSDMSARHVRVENWIFDIILGVFTAGLRLLSGFASGFVLTNDWSAVALMNSVTRPIVKGVPALL